MRAFDFGKPRYARNSDRFAAWAASFGAFASESTFFASVRKPCTTFCCTFTKLTTFGFSSSNSCTSPFGVGPEMMSGVRASSMSTESTSSTMA